MTPSDILQCAAADGVKLTIFPPETVRATGKPSAVHRWLPEIRAHKSELIQQVRSDALRPAFELVMTAFRTPADEIELAWSIALANLPAAEAAFHSSAAMIRAGWRPLHEQAAAFLARQGLPDELEGNNT